MSDASGYLNDPYKILSVVDPLTGEPVPRATGPGLQGPSHEYRFENRPVLDFLKWASRETGKELVFESEAVRREAMSTRRK